MTTEITTIYTGLVTRIETLLSTHKRLTNPYDLAGNSDQILAKAWGLCLRPGANTRRIMSCANTVKRNFTIPITRKFVSRELDATKKADCERDLMEDLQILIDDFEKNNALIDTGKYTVSYNGDTGIVPVKQNQDAFLAVVVEVSVDYQRTPT